MSSEILQQAVAELEGGTLPESLTRIPWGHNLLLLEKIADPALRIWYARQDFENGWSRETLWYQLVVHEREIESALIRHMRQFLLELGVGFMFAGSQYRLVVGGDEFYLDLLFYHHKLRCFVVIELKNSAFKPEYVGKMGFYLTAVDELLKHPDDNPTIGLILCRSKNTVVAEYAMRPLKHPIGVAEYRLAQTMPDELAASLPSPAMLEAELRAIPHHAGGTPPTTKTVSSSRASQRAR